ncbi:MAG: ABC transporter permease [Vicinamibacterales bacterium]
MTPRDQLHPPGWRALRTALRVALLAFPRRHRARFADEMLAMARDRAADAYRAGGPAALVRRSVAMLANVVGHGAAERWRIHIHGASARRPTFESPGAGGRRVIETLAADARYACRRMRHESGATGAVVLTLGLAIGANAAIFTLVNAVLVRPLPYDDASRIAVVWHDNVREQKPRDPLSFATFADAAANAGSFGAMAAVSPVWDFAWRSPQGVEHVTGQWISASLLPLLGVRPRLGRGFTSEEDVAGGARTVVVSDRFWRRLFGDAGDLAERRVVVDDESLTIVGVMPPGFRLFAEVDLWRPAAQNPVVPRGPQVRLFTVLGRLAPSASLESAQAELAALTQGWKASNPDAYAGLESRVVPLEDEIVGNVRRALLTLQGAVAVVWLIACANIGSLSMTRALERRHELAVRTVLGASRRRLLTGASVESAIVGLLSGALGLGVTLAATGFVRGFDGVSFPRQQELVVDWHVLAFCAGCAMLTALATGVLPSLLSFSAPAGRTLRHSIRGGADAGLPLRRVIVVAEVAAAVLLLTGASLLVRSFIALAGTDPGFRPAHVVTLPLSASAAFRDATRRGRLFDDLFDRLGALPGVEAAGGVTRLPLGRLGGVTTRVEVEGQPLREGERPEIEFRRASRHYFSAMAIPLLEGRGFSDDDTAGSPAVMLVNRRAAVRLWPGEPAVGKRLRTSGDADWATVVGVVGDIRHFSLDREPEAEVYIPFSQGPPFSPFVAIRVHDDPAALASAVRAIARELDPDVLLGEVTTMDALVDESVARPRLNARLMSGLALAALALAVLGLYAVLTHATTQRTAELGVRAALGATGLDLFRMVIGQGLWLTAIGLAVGVGLSAILTRLLSSLLYGVTALDPLTFIGVPVGFVAVALVACAVPARRAIRVDPIVALRGE